MNYFLAMDAGGTKTDFVLADETHELARARTGSIKRLRTDAVTASNNLDLALHELTAKSGIAMSAITRTCVGTAGESVPLVTDWLREAIGSRVAGDLLLLGDVEIALDAAFPGAAGVLVLAGTGSNIAGRSSTGKMISAGGWGPMLADQGSGYRIGQEALRALFLARDECRTTLLQPAVLGLWKLTSIEQLVEFANSTPSPDFSQLAEIVLRCAQQGDVIAKAVLRRQGVELGYLVRLVIRHLRALNQPGWIPAIAFAGSIMEHITPVRDALVEAIQFEFAEVRMMAGVVDPLGGALWRARNSSTT